ncbi:hypothetical protein PIB30_019653 [Stylosanthes scabra]|uniref:Uncharacterized protein n=1 Tax=Stylosanthes scabra TaxID=79078 RepID=A0ABU6S8Y9_9FABA|nr:hypothetical protein [Stylosanthes scabra]
MKGWSSLVSHQLCCLSHPCLVSERGMSLVKWNSVITPKKYGVQLLSNKYRSSLLGDNRSYPCTASSLWQSIHIAFQALKDGYSWSIEHLDQSFWYNKWGMTICLAPRVPADFIRDGGLRGDPLSPRGNEDGSP